MKVVLIVVELVSARRKEAEIRALAMSRFRRESHLEIAIFPIFFFTRAESLKIYTYYAHPRVCGLFRRKLTSLLALARVILTHAEMIKSPHVGFFFWESYVAWSRVAGMYGWMGGRTIFSVNMFSTIIWRLLHGSTRVKLAKFPILSRSHFYRILCTYRKVYAKVASEDFYPSSIITPSCKSHISEWLHKITNTPFRRL